MKIFFKTVLFVIVGLLLFSGCEFGNTDSESANNDSFQDSSRDQKVIIGTPGNDSIGGTYMPETIHGLSGNNRIYAHGGSDVIWGGNDIDEVYGGYGCDFIIGRSGTNYLYGDEHASIVVNNYNSYYDSDIIYGGPRTDYIWGGNGNDRIDPGTGYNEIHTGTGEDLVIIHQGGDDNILYLGRDRDVVMLELTSTSGYKRVKIYADETSRSTDRHRIFLLARDRDFAQNITVTGTGGINNQEGYIYLIHNVRLYNRTIYNIKIQVNINTGITDLNSWCQLWDYCFSTSAFNSMWRSWHNGEGMTANDHYLTYLPELAF